jgi:hypothetical protein
MCPIGHLYHFTDYRNVPLIKAMNGIWSTEHLRSRNIAFLSGGDLRSLNQDHLLGMDQYVHLCFTRNHPME